MYLQIIRIYGLIAGISGSILCQLETLHAHGEWTRAIQDYNDRVVSCARYRPQTSRSEVVVGEGPHEVHSLILKSVSKVSRFRDVDKVITDFFSFEPWPIVEERITYRWSMKCINCGENLLRSSNVTHKGQGGPVLKVGTVRQGNYREFSTREFSTGKYSGTNEVCNKVKSTIERVSKESLMFDQSLALSLMEEFPKPESWADARTVNVAGYNYTITGIPFLNKDNPASYQRWKDAFPSLLRTAEISDRRLRVLWSWTPLETKRK